MANKLKNELVVGNRSQAEQIVIDILRLNFRKISILPNDKTAIGKEIDVYLPDFRVGIELDGIFHYKNIHGDETLQRIQRNDEKKDLLCEERGVKLFRIKLPEKSGDTYTFLKKEMSDRIVPEIKKLVPKTI